MATCGNSFPATMRVTTSLKLAWLAALAAMLCAASPGRTMIVTIRKILTRWLRAAVLVVAVADLLAGTPTAQAADWPQWRGPNRDGSSTETGWRSQWPEGGPKVLWKAKVGAGHSSVVVVGERAYAVGRSWKVDAKGLSVKGENGRNVGSETVWCFDANTGKVVWQHATDCQNLGCNDWGTNSTPAVFDGLATPTACPARSPVSMGPRDERSGPGTWPGTTRRKSTSTAPTPARRGRGGGRDRRMWK